MYKTPQGRPHPDTGENPYPAHESKSSEYNWSMFGYPEAMINMAAARDDELAMEWIHENGWIDFETRTLDEKTMLQFLEMKKAKRCIKALKTLGYK